MAECQKGFFETSMKPFNEAVGLWMIRGRHVDANAPYPGQLLEEERRKLRSPIRSYGRRDAKVLHPACHEGVYNGLSGNVDQWNCAWPSSKPVYYRE